MAAEIKSHRFDVRGMSCASCAARIEKVLASDPHNKSATVNFSAGTATVTSSLAAHEIKNAIEGLGYGAEESLTEKQRLAMEALLIARAKRDTMAAVMLTVPVVVLGMILPDMAGSGIIQGLLSALVLAGPGRGFFMRAGKQLRHREASMDTLVSMGTGAAFLFSLYLLIQGHSHLYFESAAVIITFILVGKFLEERARQSIAKAVRELMRLQPAYALVIKLPGEAEERERQVTFEEVPVGAMVLVRPGDRFPVDGVVVRGVSAVDAAMLTGESMPVDVSTGSLVAAGTINLTGPLMVDARATGEQTELAHIVAMVEAAQGTKAPIQKLADQIAGWFVPAAISIAAATFVAWLAYGSALEVGLTAAVAVLVVACPCALGLATPVAIMAGTARAARRGILVKDAAALQILHKATTIVFDKTGTLTTGRPEVVGFELFENDPRDTVIAWAAALEAGSNHPLARAIMRYATDQGVGGLPQLRDVRETPGVGIHGKLDEPIPIDLMIGKLTSFAVMPGVEAVFNAMKKEPSHGQTYVGLAKNNRVVAVFKLRDTLRVEAKEAIATLIRLGLKPILATGDGEAAALGIAHELGGLEVHFGQTPAEKSALIETLKATGQIVAMAGDGINDSPALAAADVGLAMGSGADAAIAVAGITLKDSSIAKVVEAVELSRLTFRNIKQNLFWAFAYNVLLIPTAAMGRLSPMLAGAAMAMSSLFVVGNALRLKSR